MADSTGTTAWTYDADERVTSLASPNGTVTYAYDADGRCTQRGVANTFFWNYAFYNVGLLRTATPPYGGTALYVYDAADRMTSQTDGNGAVASFTYNDLDEMTAEATVTSGGSQIAGDTYTYYPNGTVHAKTDFDGSTTTYGYDGADQLTSEARTSPNAYSVSYTYDHNYNRLTKTLNGQTDTYFYDAGDKLLHTSTKTFTYDTNGNRLTMTTGGATTTYNWDYEDRLTSIAGTSASNTYNGLGLRVIRTSTSGASSYYTYDGAEPGDTVLRDGPNVYTEGLCQTLIATGATSWYILDRLGSNSRMMNSSESVTDSQIYDGFGTSVVRTGSTSMPFGFVAKSGYETDSDTGLILLGHRFYDPSVGRFLSRDPIHNGDNDYAYCENNPVASTDPTGEYSVGEFLKLLEGLVYKPVITVNQPIFGQPNHSGDDIRDITSDTEEARAVAPGAGHALGNGEKEVVKTVATSAATSVVGPEGTEAKAVEGEGEGAILIAQKSISRTFGQGEGNPLQGRTIESVVADLKSGKLSPDKLPIKYVVRDG